MLIENRLQDVRKRQRKLRIRRGIGIICAVIILLLLWWCWGRQTAQAPTITSGANGNSGGGSLKSTAGVSEAWVQNYVASHMLQPSDILQDGTLNQWLQDNMPRTTTSSVTQNILGADYTAGSGIDISGHTISALPVLPGTDIADGSITFADLGLVGCDAGAVLKFDGISWGCGVPPLQFNALLVHEGRLAQFNASGQSVSSAVQQTTDGIVIDSGYNLALTDGVISGDGSGITNLDGANVQNGSITFDKLGQNGCIMGQIIKWNGTAWACATDDTGGGGAVYYADDGISLDGDTFTLDTTHANSWAASQTFVAGVTIGGETVTDLTGDGLSLTGGTLSTTLGTSIEGSEITDGTITAADIASGAVTTDAILDGTITGDDLATGSVGSAAIADASITSADIADGAITFDKLADMGCAGDQIIKWSGTTWVCADDEIGTDTNTTYGAGSGLTLAGTTFSLDTAHANTWSAAQTFSDGIDANGDTITDFTGDGLAVSGGVLSATLGDSIDSAEIEDGTITGDDIAAGAISFANLSNGGCTTGQIIKWDGSAWTCDSDDTGVDTNTTYTAGSGLALSGTTFSLDMAHANTWTVAQNFAAGVTIDGDTFTSLAGDGLYFDAGTLNATLGDSVEGSEITDGTITAADLATGAVDSNAILDGSVTGNDIAAGAISFANLSNGGCTTGQIIKWDSGGWTCADDEIGIDTDTTYSAGSGLTLAGTTFSLDTAHANTWSAPQTFSDGIDVNGDTITNFAGNGLEVTGGVLGATLGDSIDSAEIEDGTITSDDLATGSVGSAAIADGSITGTDIADGAIALDKLADMGCTSNQIIKWSGLAWACATDEIGTDTNTTYSAGSGLTLTSTTLSLDAAHANTWTANQTFGAGATIGGETFVDLTGDGLYFDAGVLTATLGDSIDSAEIEDGTITAADIATGAVTTDEILDGTILGTDIANGAITGTQIAAGTVTTSNLSTASRKRVVTADLGTISGSLLGTSVEIPIFVAPTNGTITRVSFTTSSSVNVNIGSTTMGIKRESAPSGSVAVLSTNTVLATGAFVPYFVTSLTNTTFSTNDVFSYVFSSSVVSLSLQNLLVTIEYIPSD